MIVNKTEEREMVNMTYFSFIINREQHLIFLSQKVFAYNRLFTYYICMAFILRFFQSQLQTPPDSIIFHLTASYSTLQHHIPPYNFKFHLTTSNSTLQRQIPPYNFKSHLTTSNPI